VGKNDNSSLLNSSPISVVTQVKEKKISSYWQIIRNTEDNLQLISPYKTGILQSDYTTKWFFNKDGTYFSIGAPTVIIKKYNLVRNRERRKKTFIILKKLRTSTYLTKLYKTIKRKSESVKKDSIVKSWYNSQQWNDLLIDVKSKVKVTNYADNWLVNKKLASNVMKKVITLTNKKKDYCENKKKKLFHNFRISRNKTPNKS